MNLFRTIPFGLLGLFAALALLGPVMALLAVLLGLLSLFAVAVAGWALVLLAERWIDEGRAGYGYPEALTDSLNQIVLGWRVNATS